eukprot:1158528-Pelagomonas_calceolata.AAC.5
MIKAQPGRMQRQAQKNKPPESNPKEKHRPFRTHRPETNTRPKSIKSRLSTISKGCQLVCRPFHCDADHPTQSAAHGLSGTASVMSHQANVCTPSVPARYECACINFCPFSKRDGRCSGTWGGFGKDPSKGCTGLMEGVGTSSKGIPLQWQAAAMRACYWLPEWSVEGLYWANGVRGHLLQGNATAVASSSRPLDIDEACFDGRGPVALVDVIGRQGSIQGSHFEEGHGQLIKGPAITAAWRPQQQAASCKRF